MVYYFSSHTFFLSHVCSLIRFLLIPLHTGYKLFLNILPYFPLVMLYSVPKTISVIDQSMTGTLCCKQQIWPSMYCHNPNSTTPLVQILINFYPLVNLSAFVS